MKEKNVVLGVTASIAIYKACEITRRLLQDNIGLSIIMTQHARRLISPQVFSSLICGRDSSSRGGFSNGVYWDEFVNPENFKIQHISLAKRANLVLVAPATANIIGKIASGIADDLLATTILASRSPVLIAPAMNESMYKNKIVQANIKKLKNLGYKFIEPTTGKLACGDVGVGRLADVETIIRTVKKHL